MEEKLSLRYDREADILYLDRGPPYAEQESEELGDDVIARLNPVTGLSHHDHSMLSWHDFHLMLSARTTTESSLPSLVLVPRSAIALRVWQGSFTCFQR